MEGLLYVVSAVFVLYLLAAIVSTVFVVLNLVVRSIGAVVCLVVRKVYRWKAWRRFGIGKLTDD